MVRSALDIAGHHGINGLMRRVRLATREDVPRILEISNWAAINTPANFAHGPEPLDAWLKSYDETCRMYPWLVAANNDAGMQGPRGGEGDGVGVIGFAKASPWKGRCAYDWSVETSVYIDPRFHRRGIGLALYNVLFPMLKAQGYYTALAGITLPNDGSVGLHELMGMKRVALLERVGWKFNTWHDVGYWQCDLRQPGAGGPPGKVRPVAEVLKECGVN
jgi:phosphinothricin acetyltransferase